MFEGFLFEWFWWCLWVFFAWFCCFFFFNFYYFRLIGISCICKVFQKLTDILANYYSKKERGKKATKPTTHRNYQRR